MLVTVEVGKTTMMQSDFRHDEEQFYYGLPTLQFLSETSIIFF